MNKRAGKDALSGRPAMFWPTDQAVIAAIALLALGFVVGKWYVAGGRSDTLIEIDDAEVNNEKKSIDFVVDLNTASWSEFSLLPGIGKVTAHRIVESRERDGNFFCHDDLLRVEGIGPQTLKRMKPYLLSMEVAGNFRSEDVNNASTDRRLAK